MPNPDLLPLTERTRRSCNSGRDQALAIARTGNWRPEFRSLFDADAGEAPDHIDVNSAPADKLALFATLFRGRPDVYARRWHNERTGTADAAVLEP